MRNIKLCICFYADVDWDKLLHLHGVLINSEEFYFYSPVFEQRVHLHNKPSERKKSQRIKQLPSSGWEEKRITMKSPNVVKELLI